MTDKLEQILRSKATTQRQKVVEKCETPPDNNKVYEKLQDIDDNILKHRKEDFSANKKFGQELKEIHKILGKWIFIVLILVFICGILSGGIIVAHKENILPYISYALDGARTANNLIGK